MYDTIIVGAGPAGLTAALYLLRSNKKVLVFEAKNYGGKIVMANKIENYPGIENISGFDFATNLYNQVKKLGCEIKYETVLKVDEDKNVFTDKGQYNAKAVIIATGTSNRKLNINGEEEFMGKGVSYCATCDGNFFKGKTVAVVGGGSSAFDEALYLSDIANKVYLINRTDQYKASEDVVNKVINKENISILNNSTVVSINGDSLLQSIDVKNNDDKIDNIEVNGLFIAIGQEPKNDIFKNIVDVDNLGFILTTDGVHTKTPNIYVAGDNRVKELRQLTTAASDGSIAATIAIKEMNN